jgi:hypothetical protein
VSIAQVAQLAARTSEVQTQLRQMQAAVSLILAIGGGRSELKLPTENQTLHFGPFDYGVPQCAYAHRSSSTLRAAPH